MTDIDPFEIPDFLRLTPEQRAIGWANVAIRNMPTTVDRREDSPDVVAFRAQLALTAKAKAHARIAKMKTKRAGVPEGKRWCSRTNKWVKL